MAQQNCLMHLKSGIVKTIPQLFTTVWRLTIFSSISDYLFLKERKKVYNFSLGHRFPTYNCLGLLVCTHSSMHGYYKEAWEDERNIQSLITRLEATSVWPLSSQRVMSVQFSIISVEVYSAYDLEIIFHLSVIRKTKEKLSPWWS